ARFYFKRILPRTKSLVETMNSGVNSLMDMEVDNFGFY
ncbi:MAG TPA: acyl-CoA dehydrogenase C-terminal domain-containing protein, partial [Candidatus Kapabacteria bacterium]|nr:acyl-CoA dehydrogenase C-terminal domain-containing protein [Candidatus Kapabacteria bacterium]